MSATLHFHMGCGTCVSKCPMSLPATDHVKSRCMEDSECILCGECVAACPNKAISFGFGRGRKI